MRFKVFMDKDGELYWILTNFTSAMESNLFKKIVTDVLVANGFSKDGSYYYLSNSDVVIVVGIQKSNYSLAYYINIGFIIRKLNPTIEKPKDVDGDIRTRFDFQEDGKLTDLFDLEKFSQSEVEKLKNALQTNIDQYIKPVDSLNGLRSLLVLQPALLYQTKFTAKQFLGLSN